MSSANSIINKFRGFEEKTWIIKANPGFEILEIADRDLDVRLRHLPVVAWQIEPNGEPQPIAPGLMFNDYPAVINQDDSFRDTPCALKYPDGSIAFAGSTFEDEDRFLRELKGGEVIDGWRRIGKHPEVEG